MMNESGYENVYMDFYYKVPNSDLDNSLRKLETDKDVLELLKYIAKYKVMNLYFDHSVSKKPKIVDPSFFIRWKNVAHNTNDVLEGWIRM